MPKKLTLLLLFSFVISCYSQRNVVLIIADDLGKDYCDIYENLKSRNLDRKEFAIRAKHYRHSNILFNMLDGTNPKKTIWKIL